MRDEGVNGERKPSQYQAKVRRSARDGSARQDAEQDTSYGRPSQRGSVQTGWGTRKQSSDRRNNAYDDRDTRRDDSRERARNSRQGRSDYRDPPRTYPGARGYSAPGGGDERRGYSRERSQRNYNELKRDEESAPARERSRDRQPPGRYEPPTTDEKERREPRQTNESRPTREQGETQTQRGRGYPPRGYPPRGQSRSATFAKDVQPNTARPSAARQERNARFASATINRAAFDEEADRGRDSPLDRLSGGTDFPSDGEYHSSEDDVPAGNGH